MKRVFRAVAGLTVLFSLVALMLNIDGCKSQDSPSLYDPNWVSLPQPIIDSLSPAGGALAGLDTLVIYGKHFSANIDSDGIYFNSTPGHFISVSTSKLVLRAPAVTGDSVQIRVWVLGALDFSPTIKYSLQAAISQFTTLSSTEYGYGTCIGPDSNVYISLSNSQKTPQDEGIFKLGVDGSVPPAPEVKPTSSNIDWSAIKYGPDGNIYAVKGNRAVYKLVPGQSNPGGTPWLAAFTPTPISFSDLDFDPDHNLWVGGNNKNIYSVNISNKSTQAFPFDGNVHSLRYYNGYLYIASTNTVLNGDTVKEGAVYRATVSGGNLGTPQQYFDITSDPTGGNNIYAIAFSSDGDMYAGTDSADFMIVVHPGGIPDPRYQPYVASGVLNSPCRSFAWIGKNLYATTLAGEVLKILPRKTGAPYYGLQ